jgi:hypothetical protein
MLRDGERDGRQVARLSPGDRIMSARILLDPTNEARPPVRTPATRLATLDGARVGLLDISKPRGSVFLDRLEQRLLAQGASVERYKKPTFTKPAPADLRHEIAVKCDAVVEALAD